MCQNWTRIRPMLTIRNSWGRNLILISIAATDALVLAILTQYSFFQSSFIKLVTFDFEKICLSCLWTSWKKKINDNESIQNQFGHFDIFLKNFLLTILSHCAISKHTDVVHQIVFPSCSRSSSSLQFNIMGVGTSLQKTNKKTSDNIHFTQTLWSWLLPWLILGLRPAHERGRCFVMTTLIGWAQAHKQPWLLYLNWMICDDYNW